MSSRKTIIRNIQQACHDIQDAPAMPVFTDHRPELSHEQQIERFTSKAEKAHSNVYLTDWASFQEKLPFYCEALQISDIYCPTSLKQRIHCNPLFNDAITTDLSVIPEGAALVEARYGLYETGTVICCSNDQDANALFLPKHLFIVLSVDNLVWDITTACHQLQQQNIWPRMINCITGPSCTADIEQTLLYGAHGPKTLSIFLIRS